MQIRSYQRIASNQEILRYFQRPRSRIRERFQQIRFDLQAAQTDRARQQQVDARIHRPTGRQPESRLQREIFLQRELRQQNRAQTALFPMESEAHPDLQGGEKRLFQEIRQNAL